MFEDSKLFKYGYPALQMFLQGATPGTARAGRGLDAGLRLSDYFGQRSEQQAKEKERARVLDEVRGMKKPTGWSINEAPERATNENFVIAEPSIGLGPPKEVPPDIRTEVPVFSPEVQRLSQIMAPDKAADFLAAQVIPKQPAPMHPGGHRT